LLNSERNDEYLDNDEVVHINYKFWYFLLLSPEMPTPSQAARG
jgi:hypothetical protein